MSDFQSFISSVFKHWMSYLGVVSFLIGITNKIRGKEWVLKNKTYMLIAWILLFFGCFAAWKSEHSNLIDTKNNLIKAQGKLDEAIDDKSPKLSGSIDVLDQTRIPNFQGILVFIELSIRNLGFPSIVENYYLTIDSPDLHLFCNAVKLTPPITIPATSTTSEVTFTENEAIYQKTISPVVGGDFKRGWLCYQITNATWEQLTNTNVQWVVSFDDITGKRYYTTNDYSRLNRRGGGISLPGSETSF